MRERVEFEAVMFREPTAERRPIIIIRGVARIFQGGVQFAEILLTSPTF